MLNFNWWVNRKDPAGPQRLRRRLPRPRQHRRLRSQRAAAHRRLAGAGRRHGLDGVLLPEHAGDGARSWPSTTRCTRRSPSSSSSTSCGSPTRWTASASNHDEMWDEEDGFFYDVLRLPDGQAMRLKVRSMVGLLPLCASTVFEGDLATRYPKLRGADRAVPQAPPGARVTGGADRRRVHRLQRAAAARRSSTRRSSSASSATCSTRTSSSGRTASARSRAITWIIRSRSTSARQHVRGAYLPAESNTGMFGGNSNWRGPVWMPVNALIVRGAAEPVRLLRRRLHGRVPDRLRQAA